MRGTATVRGPEPIRPNCPRLDAPVRQGLPVPVPAVGIGDDPALVSGRRGQRRRILPDPAHELRYCCVELRVVPLGLFARVVVTGMSGSTP